MSWTLDPAAYRCPDHDLDLTDDVRLAAIPEQGSPVDRHLDAPADAPSDWSPEGPFNVKVTCPGVAKDGRPAEPHGVRFEGEVR